MKTRTGFVSNSSSSSFIAYGYTTDDANGAYRFLEKIAPEVLTDEHKQQYEETTVDFDDIESILYDHPMGKIFEVNPGGDNEVMFGYMIYGAADEDGINIMDPPTVEKINDELAKVGITPEIIYGNY